MIHELIDPKKKKNKTSVTGNSKTKQNSKNIFEYCNFESSYYENKNTESSSATFIPPWLRNSLGLNQRNLLSHATACSDQKSSKIIQKNKEISRNEFDTLNRNTEQDSCKVLKNQNELVLKDCPEETTVAKVTDDAESVTVKSENVPAYWKIRSKVSESESNEAKYFGKRDWIKIESDVLTSEEIGELKEEDIRKIKLFRQQSKLKKRMTTHQKPSNLNKTDIEFLLQMKARKVLEGFKSKEVHSISPEIRNLETKLLLLGAKSHDPNNYKLKQQDIRLLQEMKNQMVGIEDFERLVEHLKELSLREMVKKSEFLTDVMIERKREEKDDKKEKKNGREITQKYECDARLNKGEDCPLSTDDEDNVKKFSQFLSKNDNLEEKKKCLEEVRNYFEKKRKLRLTKRNCLEDEKNKAKFEKKEDSIQDKSKAKNSLKDARSKYGLCSQDVVEKAVEDTLQKFIDLYKINATPHIMENMKRSIFHCISSSFPKVNCSPFVEGKINLDQPNLGLKEFEKMELSFPEGVELSKEIKKRQFKTLVESSEGHNLLKEPNMDEEENIKRLKKEFDDFLNSVQFHIDFTNLKLQSVILEKEEKTSPSKNLQFVYNFTKKSLEQEKTVSEVSEVKNRSDTGAQTVTEIEISKRNVKVQAFEPKFTCEKILQTETAIGVTQATQTNSDRVDIRELKELKNNDVNPGLYRMIKSREPGKFYLYPEELDDRKPSNNCSFLANKKLHRKKELMNLVSKSSSKDRRYFHKEKEKAKLKKINKLSKALVRLEEMSNKNVDGSDAKGDSVNCLYFKSLGRSHSRLLTPKKKGESTTVKSDDSEELELRDARHNFWFWNGEKITPGCDLKTHVEKLLKEKLTEMASFDGQNKRLTIQPECGIKKSKKDSRKVSKKNASLHFSDVLQREAHEDPVLSEGEHPLEINKTEQKKNESEETEEVPPPLCEEKPVKNVGTQNSEQLCTSTNLSKVKIQTSKVAFPAKKKINKGNLVLKNRRGKPVNVKKAENIVQAIEELKRMKLGPENSKNGGERDSESVFNFSLSTKESKNEVDGPLPMIYGHQENLEVGNSDFKNKLKKLVSLVNCEIQRNDVFDAEDGNLIQNPPAEDHKHMELIETVLNRITHKERENLWNDVRDFINTRINRDVNDDDDREVCIEIEQDLPKNDRGKLHDLLAKGHYRRNEGDIEVEIDLTLDDLEKILRQRQKKIRRRTLYRSSVSNKFLSTSSIQSEFTRDDFWRYQTYMQNLTSEQDHVQEKEMKAFL